MIRTSTGADGGPLFAQRTGAYRRVLLFTHNLREFCQQKRGLEGPWAALEGAGRTIREQLARNQEKLLALVLTLGKLFTPKSKQSWAFTRGPSLVDLHSWTFIRGPSLMDLLSWTF